MYTMLCILYKIHYVHYALYPIFLPLSGNRYATITCTCNYSKGSLKHVFAVWNNLVNTILYMWNVVFLCDFFSFSAIIIPCIIVVVIIVVVVVIIIKKSKYDSMTKIKKICSFSFKMGFFVLVSKFNVSVTLDNGCLSTEFLGTALLFHRYFSSRDNELVFVCLFVFWYFLLLLLIIKN